ncbi:PAS domain S-box protein [Zoogloea sp.]|uniref:sensor histidine kinase n=1 Tax=Zoogloea sp. TaxID=49181 RepID=UPI001416CBA3|nr:MAG: PAS domain S-box protein [Zoogloea sp.]
MSSPLSITLAFGLGALTSAALLAALIILLRTRKAWRKDRDLLRCVFDESAVGMAVASPSGHYIRVNRAMCEFVGYPEAELLGMSYLDITHPDDLDENLQGRGRILQGELQRFQQEKRYIRKDGQVIWALMVVSPVLDADGRVTSTVGQMLNIDYQKKVEHDLRTLSGHQKTIVEDERTRIAREIHDDLGQRLTALKLDISLLRLGFGHNPELLRLAESMGRLLDDTMETVRRISSNLRPAALDLGLVAALEWLAEDLELRSGICCRLDTGDEDIALDENRATVVFRVVQESLTNVVRHAEASEVRIALRSAETHLSLQIQDNGRGFNPKAPSPCRGFGLLSMEERVRALGGHLRLESAPGAGVSLSIFIPLPDAVPA